PVYQWHEANEAFLLNRKPMATVAVLWSQENMDFFGRDAPETLVELPWRGLTQALVQARIPYVPLHADDLERAGDAFSVIVLPALAAMSDAQIASVRRFAERGCGVLATGASSRLTEEGEPRPDFGLADLFGAHVDQASWKEADNRRHANETLHTYLRLS